MSLLWDDPMVFYPVLLITTWCVAAALRLIGSELAERAAWARLRVEVRELMAEHEQRLDEMRGGDGDVEIIGSIAPDAPPAAAAA